jgi:hypothetical protein
MRLLVVDAGGLRAALPLEAVAGVTPHDGERHRGPTLASLLGLPDRPAHVVLHVRDGQGRTASLGACASEGICDAPVYPLRPIVAGGRRLPLLGMAGAQGNLLPTIDPSYLGCDDGPAATDMPDVPGPLNAPREPSDTPRDGEPLLICALGAYTLRRRPLAIGIPLAAVAGIESETDAVFLPQPLGALVGLSRTGDRGVPVYDVAALLGVDAASTVHNGGALVVLRHAAAALHIPAAVCVERPLHWAPPETLAPLRHAACAGAIPARERWTAVVHPARLLQNEY